jgi:hypothetical protein
MRPVRFAILALGIGVAISSIVPMLVRGLADTKPNVQLNTANAGPREVEETTQKAILRDYTAAWQAINSALSNNSTEPLQDNFVGFALAKLTNRVKDQRTTGLRTRILDHGHKVDAIFYSRDGAAIQLRDTANIETQILDGDSVIHTDQAQVQYIAVMTGAEDRWKVRVLESEAAR